MWKPRGSSHTNRVVTNGGTVEVVEAFIHDWRTDRRPSLMFSHSILWYTQHTHTHTLSLSFLVIAPAMLPTQTSKLVAGIALILVSSIACRSALTGPTTQMPLPRTNDPHS